MYICLQFERKGVLFILMCLMVSSFADVVVCVCLCVCVFFEKIEFIRTEM